MLLECKSVNEWHSWITCTIFCLYFIFDTNANAKNLHFLALLCRLSSNADLPRDLIQPFLLLVLLGLSALFLSFIHTPISTSQCLKLKSWFKRRPESQQVTVYYSMGPWSNNWLWKLDRWCFSTTTSSSMAASLDTTYSTSYLLCHWYHIHTDWRVIILVQ